MISYVLLRLSKIHLHLLTLQGCIAGAWFCDSKLKGSIYTALHYPHPHHHKEALKELNDEIPYKYNHFLQELRPHAIGLVDAWDFFPRQLQNSTLGAFDGQYAHRLWVETQRNPLNRTSLTPIRTQFDSEQQERERSFLYLVRHGPQALTIPQTIEPQSWNKSEDFVKHARSKL